MRPWIPAIACFKLCGIALWVLHHERLGLVVFFAPDPWLLMQFLSPGSQAFGPAVTRFEGEARAVWLTIDDGPDPSSTPQVLDLLRLHRAKATFFVVGDRVRLHPELARQIVAAGHTLANHTDNHPAATLWSAGPSRTASQIDGCIAALLLAGAPFERYFRPPVGVRNPFLDRELAARGMDLVLWSARGFDGAGRNPQAALARVVRRIRPGCIILSHEGGPHAKERFRFLELLLEHLSAEGYDCVLPSRGAFRLN